MQVFNDIDAFAAACGPCAVALGMFDGVHLGHRQLLARVLQRAQALGVASAVLTYPDTPARVFAPHAAPALIQPVDEKLATIARLGVQAALCQPFTREYAARSGEDFVRDLVDRIQARAVVVGYNYTFGAGARLGSAQLSEMLAARGVECCVQPPVLLEGEPVSSTRVRAALQAGEAELAQRLLGEPYSICGTVAHGKHLGHTLGFPTCNIDITDGRLLPRAGVYACRAQLKGRWLPGMLNLGRQPTAPIGHVTCEVNVFSDIGDVYGEPLRIEFLHFIRPEVRFESLDELTAQLSRDREAIRRWFSAC